MEDSDPTKKNTNAKAFFLSFLKKNISGVTAPILAILFIWAAKHFLAVLPVYDGSYLDLIATIEFGVVFAALAGYVLLKVPHVLTLFKKPSRTHKDEPKYQKIIEFVVATTVLVVVMMASGALLVYAHEHIRKVDDESGPSRT